MSQLTIKTDNKWKMFKYNYEVPKRVLKKQFDYLAEDEKEDGFIMYRKTWYHISDFLNVHGLIELNGWHGHHSVSFFSGVVIKFSDDEERYKIGAYYS